MPTTAFEQRQLNTSWRDILSYCSWRTVAAALGMLTLLILTITVLGHFTVLRISIMSLVIGVVRLPFSGFDGLQSFAPPVRSNGAGSGELAAWTQLLTTALVVLVARWFLRRIPEFALREEQLFREGCEGWSWPERARACMLFGAAHLTNVWYPLTSVIALAVGGGIFMWWYLLEHRRSRDREKALRCATALHATYNGIAVSAVAATLLLAIWL